MLDALARGFGPKIPLSATVAPIGVVLDGTPTPTFKGDGALITVAVPTGAQEVRLTFESEVYRIGKRIMLASVVMIVVGFAAPILVRRHRRA